MGGKNQCISFWLAQKQITKCLLGEAIIWFCVIEPEGMSLRQVQDELYKVLAGSEVTRRAKPYRLFLSHIGKQKEKTCFYLEVYISM